MQNKAPQNRPQSSPSRRPAGRPIMDITPQRQPSRSFPDVGVTLSSYRTSAAAAPPIRSRASGSGNQARRPLAPAATQPRRSRFGWLRRGWTKKRIAILLTAIILLAGVWVGGKFLYNALRIFRGNVFGVFNTTKLRGEDQGRVNILLAGNSADDVGHQGGELTDSIMIVSLDTKEHTAYMLSVPRDLWVDIPGYGHAKINEAYVDGERGDFNEPGYAKGGMGLLEKVIERDFGIDLHYHALVNYNAFRDAVNAVGGITVDIKSQDPRGLYDPSIDWETHGPLVKLSNGKHTLNGRQALDLARARGDAYGSYGFAMADFDRTDHQRMMLLALKSKVLSSGVLANPIKLGNLFDALGDNVRTDFTLGEVRRLYDLGKVIDNAHIKSVSLNDADGQNLLASYLSPRGQSALIPAAGVDDFSKIQLYIKKLTSHNPVLKEGAKVVVLNGTQTYGLASKTSKSLAGHSINVSAIGDALSSAPTTIIIDNSNGKKPATLKLLTELYGKHTTSANPYSATYTADFIVVLGEDQATNAKP